jgi:DNA-binding transcriptional LysR family regulator
MERLQVAFEVSPMARWAPLFHLLCLERPETRIEWQRVEFPARGRSILEGADVAVRVEPPPEPGVSSLALGVEPMVVIMAAGHALAGSDELCIAQVLDQRFPGAGSRTDSGSRSGRSTTAGAHRPRRPATTCEPPTTDSTSSPPDGRSAPWAPRWRTDWPTRA